jgi:hypothetical protein
MTRPKRLIKPTIKVLENTHINKKQKQTEILKKKIEKRQVIHETQQIKEIQTPFIPDTDIEIIRDSKNNIYKDLYYNENEVLTKLIRLTIQEYPDNKLPPIFKGVVPLYIERTPIVIKETVLLSKLQNGEYHTTTSHSDKGIASGIRTLLKIPDLQKYNNDDLTEFIKNHREVFLYILLKNKNNSISTLKSDVVKLMRVLFIALKGKTSGVYMKYAAILKDLSNTVENEDNENKLNDNEKTRYLKWEHVLNKQKELQDDFNNIINKNTKEAYNKNLDLILLSLYVLTPPLRHEPMLLLFKQDGDEIDNDYVNIRKNDVKLELNLIKKRHNNITIDLNDDLANILRQSFVLYSRRYLFTDYRKYPNMSVKLGESSVSTRLNKMFINYGVNIGSSILRSSYVSYRFDSVAGNLTAKSIKEMAILMRTSPQYINTSYRKIINPSLPAILLDDNNNVINNDKTIVIEKPIKEIKNTYTNHIAKMKEKYHDNPDYREKLLEQQGEYRNKIDKNILQKRKIISMLRNDAVYRNKIKQTTLDKYNINLNEI